MIGKRKEKLLLCVQNHYQIYLEKSAFENLTFRIQVSLTKMQSREDTADSYFLPWPIPYFWGEAKLREMLVSTQQIQLKELVKQGSQLRIFSEESASWETGNLHPREQNQTINGNSNKNCLPMASDCWQRFQGHLVSLAFWAKTSSFSSRG